ncbi:hypothetical protein GGR53DRAFT_40549 [Hypoxylon sp. FL1150]|nr:hypothetical protein GGR53DRAFT_40549 [Hypoxylon sp. FL1150]
MPRRSMVLKKKKKKKKKSSREKDRKRLCFGVLGGLAVLVVLMDEKHGENKKFISIYPRKIVGNCDAFAASAGWMENKRFHFFSLFPLSLSNLLSLLILSGCRILVLVISCCSNHEHLTQRSISSRDGKGGQEGARVITVYY